MKKIDQGKTSSFPSVDDTRPEAEIGIDHLLRGRRVPATYRTPDLPIYRHNLFIEALPKLQDEVEGLLRIGRYPYYDPEDRKKPALIRQEAVQTLDHLVIPLTVHDQLIKRFSRLIKSGYFARNPISAERVRQMRNAFPDMDPADSLLVRRNPSTFAIIGTSGGGKTTGVESCLLQIPQVIVHTQFNGKPFDRTQLVWLKLECPSDGSLKGLCINFFQAINKLMGKERSSHSYTRLSVDILIDDMAHIAAELGIGLLVIDEIQRLTRKGEASKHILDYLVELQNKIGIPVVMIGTFKAMHMLRESFAAARRGTGQGDLIWYPMAHDDEWKYFMKKLWPYQWTKHETPLTPELERTMHEESQGIIDITVKLYKIVQWELIDDENENELITPDLIRRAAAEHLTLARPILEALRKKDFNFLEHEVDDLEPLTEQLNLYLESIRSDAERRAALAQLIAEPPKTTKPPDDDTSGSLFDRLMQVLKEADYDSDTARECVHQALDDCGNQATFAKALQKALDLATKRKAAGQRTRGSTAKGRHDGQPCASKDAKVAPAQHMVPDGILATVAAGKERGLSAHESLKRVGIIETLDKYLM